MTHLCNWILRAIPAALVAASLLIGSTAHAALSWTDPWILNDDGTSTSYQEIPEQD